MGGVGGGELWGATGEAPVLFYRLAIFELPSEKIAHRDGEEGGNATHRSFPRDGEK